MTAPQTCPRKVWPADGYGDSYVCGKPVKRDGLCGVHARSVEQRAARDAEWEKQRAERAAAVEVAERLADAFPTADGVWSAGDRVTLSVADAERLIGLLGGGS